MIDKLSGKINIIFRKKYPDVPSAFDLDSYSSQIMSRLLANERLKVLIEDNQLMTGGG